MNEVTFDARQFLGAMRELKKEIPFEMNLVMRWQMGLLCKTMIEKIGSNPSWSLPTQQKKGERAVANDVRKIFEPIKTEYKWWDYKGKEFSGMKVVKTGTGSTFLVPQNKFIDDSNASSVSALHQSMRKPNGRTFDTGLDRHKKKKQYIHEKYMIPVNMLNEHIKDVQTHVGRCKACWVKAFDYFVGKSKGMISWAPPAWVTRNRMAVSQHSFQAEEVNEFAMTGKWQAGSNLAYGRNPGSVLGYAMNLRIKDLQGYALLRLQKVLNKHQARAA